MQVRLDLHSVHLFMIDLRDTTTKHYFRNEYLMRVYSVGCWVGSIIIIIYGIFLLPTLFFLNDTIQSKEKVFESIKASFKTEDGNTLDSYILETNTLLSLVQKRYTASFTDVLDTVLSVPHTGIRITDMNYSVEGDEDILLVSGIASTRETLRAFSQSLQKVEGVGKVTFPVENLAKDTNLDFAITVRGTL